MPPDWRTWDTLGRRVKGRRQALSMTQAQLAEASGLNQGDISKIERGDTLQTTKLPQLARALRCDALWLAEGAGEPEPSLLKEPWTEFQPVKPSRFKFVPVVGQGAGGDLPERIWTDGDFPVGATNEYAEVASSDPHAFIVKVVGTSMVPRFNPGEFALVEPSSEPDLEDDVLVRLADGRTMLKQLLSRRGGFVRLGSYNKSVDTIEVTKEEVTWIYYVAYPVPARKIKSRL